ncbi:hypothetical protein A1A1_07102 [Planococcus antarcticus DSM 14505]|uniref:DUF3953 domain-containing protein n=1 Tax=Planococcus antarcticus DSM 14505 TaxID=1185653 RepID=A0A1C7DFN6_9BACL|nr:hypothetical protein [Planococcus antarcticus]ANU10238.1 hypothetical protein BBH88_07960 [Planococcus antarcticus DSM 14505]EIM07145.1 hypothetical protein A1A1_07102 [Planococcus antarcticus DSM 14505]
MKIMKIILSLIVLFLVGYGLSTSNEEFLPYALLGTGVLVLFTGVQVSAQEKRKFDGYMFLAGSALFLVYGGSLILT